MRTSTVRTLAALLGIPVLVGLVSVLLVRGFVAELPDPVATHWGTDGVDGFTARGAAVWVAVGTAVGLGVLLGLVLFAASLKAPMLRRGATAAAGGMTGFVATSGVGSLWVQRGLADAHAAPDIDWLIAVALLVGAGLAAAGWLVAPGPVPGAAAARSAVPSSAPRADLSPTQQAAWTGWAGSRALVAIVVGAIVVSVGVLALAGGGHEPVLALALIPTVLVLVMGAFRVTVGRPGLVVRSVAGGPRFVVPLDEVAEAGVIDVRPMRDFGGWGLRGNFKGQFGIIQRGGEALEVRRGDGSRFVVTVDGADQAAALLNTLADRQRAGVR